MMYRRHSNMSSYCGGNFLSVSDIWSEIWSALLCSIFESGSFLKFSWELDWFEFVWIQIDAVTYWVGARFI